MLLSRMLEAVEFQYKPPKSGTGNRLSQFEIYFSDCVNWKFGEDAMYMYAV